MKPTETLRHEHQIILLVLGGIERGAESLQATLDGDAGWLDTIVDFVREFVDRCHHGKEEKHLFVRLEQRGVQHEGGPIGAMLEEHEQGRAFIRTVAAATPAAMAADAEALEAAKVGLLGYVELLRQHIATENDVLFVTADQVLTPEDQSELEEAFDRLEMEEMGEGTHEKYHKLTHELGKH